MSHTSGTRRREGFSFAEILIAVTILAMGLIPIFLAYTVSTRETRVTISQVQAINHCSNMLEALRAWGTQDFKNLTDFPRDMQQIRGSPTWQPFSGSIAGESAAGAAGTQVAAPDASAAPDGGSFAQFQKLYMEGEDPIIPKLEKDSKFTRIFELERSVPGYVTIIVKTTWPSIDISKDEAQEERSVDLRTTVADPFMFAEAGTGEAGQSGTAGPGSNPAAPGAGAPGGGTAGANSMPGFLTGTRPSTGAASSSATRTAQPAGGTSP